jgi:hypothetical protein
MAQWPAIPQVSTAAATAESYTSGTIVALSAIPATGSIFSGWAGTGSVHGRRHERQSKLYHFQCQPVQTFGLSVTKAGTGSGTVTAVRLVSIVVATARSRLRAARSSL